MSVRVGATALAVGGIAAVVVVATIVALRPSEPPAAIAPDASPTAAATAAPTAAPIGTVAPSERWMVAEPGMDAFWADRGALFARGITQLGPGRHRSRIARAVPPKGPWHVVHESDAVIHVGWPRTWKPSAGRLPLTEVRSDPGGPGAHTTRVVVLDVERGLATAFDEFSLSARTWRGGGGPPRRPQTAVALGEGAVAWTRLIEGPGGEVTGELRLAPLGAPADQTVVAGSSDTVAPLGFVDGLLVSVVATEGLELRTFDARTGAHRLVAAEPLPAPGMWTASMLGAVVGGHWAVWRQELPGQGPPVRGRPSPAVVLRVVDLRTGASRDLGPLDGDCDLPTASARLIALSCGPTGPRLFDIRTFEPLTMAASPAPPGDHRWPLVHAADDGVLITHISGDTTRVTLVRYSGTPTR